MQSLAELSILIRTKYANKSFFMQALYISVLRVAGTLLQIFTTNSSNEMITTTYISSSIILFLLPFTQRVRYFYESNLDLSISTS